MKITSNVLSKNAVTLYEAKVAGAIFCVLTDRRAKKIRFFGLRSAGNDAEELYFPPNAIVGLADAVTLKNRSALKGRFSLPAGLGTLPLGKNCYAPHGKFLGVLDAIETDRGEITAFVAGGESFSSSQLVSFSDEIVILSEKDEKYRAVPPRKTVPRVRDDRTVTIALPPEERRSPSEPLSYESAKTADSSEDTTEKPRAEAKVATFPSPAAVKPDTAPTESDERVLPDENNDKPESPIVKPAILPAATNAESGNVVRSASYAPPVRSSVLLPPRADVTVTRTPATGNDKSGYSFLIGKTMTGTVLADDGNVIIAKGERVTAETLQKAEGKLVLLALYSK